MMTCDVCDAEFSGRVNQKVCSVECRRANDAARKRHRYANDPEYREKEKARNYPDDPNQREFVLAKAKHRYETREEFRERKKEQMREHNRDRYLTDFDFREDAKERNRLS